ncbi:heme peroxidase family protein [Nostoc sp. UIC 10607]|uniref:peroxidase family protein n=1 Tax=Nostoc sp. UIC 10607 TaxID=3045935 RepID=UPI0039A01998
MQNLPFEFSHGGYIKEETVQQRIALRPPTTEAIDVETDFDYLFPDIARDPNSLLPADNNQDIIKKLKELGDAIIDREGPELEDANSKIPPVYTYWGQFIDHDITANTDRAVTDLQADITKDDFKPLSPDFITDKLKNLRRPTFDLDSVYGDGPTLDPKNPTEAKDFYQEDDPVKLKVGQNAEQNANGDPIPGAKIPPEKDLSRDLPRNNRIAAIADSRNDENLIVAQFHTAFLRFHNAVVDWVRKNEPKNAKDNKKLFVRAQTLVRWHYQWLVVNDFLKTVTAKGTVDNILRDGLKFYHPRHGNLFMPLEFSVAAYRFGHSMVRAAYDYNRNFTDQPGALTDATFVLLFAFTGKRDMGGPPGPGPSNTLPFNWIIEWDRFVDKESAAKRQRNSARKIDTHLAFPLSELLNEGNDAQPPIQQLLKHLAKRNLLRGYFLSIPTGQSLAKKLGIKKLTVEELKQGNSPELNQALEPFLEKTPAWYYVLKESEVRAKGDSLGEVGSRIVAETIIGLIKNDRSSYLNEREHGHDHEHEFAHKYDRVWNPSKGVKLANGGEIRVISDFLKFAGVLPASSC